MKIDLKIDNLEFIDFPRQISFQEYKNNKREFVGYFKCHPAVRAIYEIGSINNPGISDLDLILVLKDNGFLRRSDYEFLDTVNNYTFVHPPFVISETLFPYLNCIFYASNMHKLAGKTYKFLQPKSNLQHNQLAWLICAEAAVGRLSDIVYLITWRKEISLRKVLLKLNSIKHNINLLKNMDENGEKNEWSKFIRKISELRKSWFFLQKEEQIEKTRRSLGCGIRVLIEIIDYLSFSSKNIFNFSLKSEKEFGNYYYILPNILQIIKFEPMGNSRIKTIANPLSIIRKMGGKNQQKITRHVNDLSILTFPSELMLLFLPSNSGASETEKHLKDSLIIRGKENSFLGRQNINADLVRLRFELIDKYNEFIRNNGLSKMSFLLMGPWLIGSKARFYGLKKNVLKGMIRLGIA